MARGLAHVLRDFGFRVAAVASDAETGYRLLTSMRPSVGIVDLNLPGENGAELTRRVKARDPRVSVLLYSGEDDDRLIEQALESGAGGFALKASPPDELAKAVRVVARGGFYLDPNLRSQIDGETPRERRRALSPREREVLAGLAEGLNGEGVAARLVIAPETVRTHVRNAMEKLEAHTRTHAVVIALRSGEIER